MKRTLSLIPVLFMILANGCRMVSGPVENLGLFELVYVDRMTAPDTAAVDQPVIVTVYGNLPDPSWCFDHFELVLQSLSLDVGVFGKKEDVEAMAAQVLVPFEKDLTFTPDRQGILSIRVIGKNDTLSTTMTVLPPKADTP